tara:strand:- start:8342 stop:10141 length:1800 start_codon:yes stop_codon:yes gene_type:complete
MTKKNKKLINYTSRDFNNIKQSLVDYAKRYYPDNFKDFSDASFGSLMLDTVSYMGDVLSFYLDYQTNESFIDTAIEYNNILRLGEQVGYKEKLRANSFGIVSLYILAPVTANGSVDTDYLPILAKGSQISSNSGQFFTLIDDVDFSNPNNEIVPATATPGGGSTTSYAVKAYGRIVSGQEEVQLVNVGTFTKFLTVELSDPNITEIVSVVDSEGHEYFEVDYLSQDTIFRSVVNKDDTTRQHVPNIMVATSVPRRFIVNKKNNVVALKFGHGSESTLKTDNLTHPSNVVLKMHGRSYEQDKSFDPSKLIESDKFGIAPEKTTLKIVFRKNTTDNSNVATGGLTNLVSPILVFKPTATNASKINSVRSSLEATNEEPIFGETALPTTSELKQRVNDIFATQNRAVTANDYEALIYRMPARFGEVKRAKIVRDQDSFKRNLNLYVVSEDANGNLATSNQVLKNNLKTWINNYRMINDTIDIIDPKIINIQIDFTAVVDYEQDKFDALSTAITEVQEMFEEKLDIGQPIYITKIYDVLNNLDEIVDVVNVKITNLTTGDGDYSADNLLIENYISADGRILYAPDNVIYELKFPNLNIKGTIR